ncbi:MAG: hypothetical protein AB7G23_19310 [Vicinamibacterales bacterium]
MRLDDLTLADFGKLFRRLLVANQRQLSDDVLEETIAVYFDQVRGFPEPVVAQAIEKLIQEPGRFFPKAGDVRIACRILEADRSRRQGQQHHRDLEHRCGGCGQVFHLAGYECATGVVVGRFRCGCPPAGQGWFTPASEAWQERQSPSSRDMRQLLGQPDRPRQPAAPVEDIRSRFRQAAAPANEVTHA